MICELNEVLYLSKEKIFSPLASIKENKNVEEKDMDYDFLDWEPDFDVLCNDVSILTPAKDDAVSKIEDTEEDFDSKDMADHKPICYYVMNNGCVE